MRGDSRIPIAPILIMIAALCFSVGLAGCGDDDDGIVDLEPNESCEPQEGVLCGNGDGSYTTPTIIINGMPCIMIRTRVSDGNTVRAPDCDWSKAEPVGGGGG